MGETCWNHSLQPKLSAVVDSGSTGAGPPLVQQIHWGIAWTASHGCARHRLVSSLMSPEGIPNWGHYLGKPTWMKQPSGSLAQLNWTKKNMSDPEQQFILNKMWKLIFFVKALGNQQTNWYWPSPAAPWILQSKALKMLASAPVCVRLKHTGLFWVERWPGPLKVRCLTHHPSGKSRVGFR